MCAVESQPALRERHRKRLMRKAKSDLKSIAEEEQVRSLMIIVVALILIRL